MTYPAQHDYYYDSYEENPPARWEMVAEDRVGPQRARRRRKRLTRALVLIAVLGGAGWTHHKDPTVLPHIWSTAVEVTGPIVKRTLEKLATPSDTTAVAGTKLTAGDASITHDAAAKSNDPIPSEPAADQFLPATAAVSPTLVTSPPEEVPSTETAAAAKPPVVIATLPAEKAVKPYVASKRAAPTDPYRARAVKAGLHPGLSRVLLSQLSKADLRNAQKTIRYALAKTPDDGRHSWPYRRKKTTKKKSKLAIFTVHFVPGAATGCRRYVVTVEKNRWLTTALPIEKCGVKRTKLSLKSSKTKTQKTKAKPRG